MIPSIITNRIKITLLLTGFLLLMTPSLNSQDFVWANRMGGVGSDAGYYITVDDNGNVYTTGFFNGTADFDPGPGILNLTSAGVNDIFVTKLDINGNLCWAKQMGGTENDYGISIAIDGNGNVYTTGFFNGAVDFNPNPGSITLTSEGYNDVFISKLDANGNFCWAKSMGGTGDDYCFCIAIDNNENVYTTGHFNGTVDFNPGLAICNLTSGGNFDSFISKLNSNGNFVWAKQFSGPNIEAGMSITFDLNGNIFTTGFFDGVTNFDPGYSNFTMTPAGLDDIFVSKLDSNGNFIWAKQMGGTNEDYGHSITIGPDNNIYVTGIFWGTADFDPGINTFNYTSAGGMDVFVSKLDSNGSFIWAKQFGGIKHDYCSSIAVDADRSVYTAGYFSDIVDFDPGTNTYNLTTSPDSLEIFINKLDENGNFYWAKQIGNNIENEEAQSIIVDHHYNIYVTGFFRGTADFDPDTSIYDLTSAGGIGGGDVYILKLSQKVTTEVGGNNFYPNGNSVNTEKEMRLFPNPASSELQIKTKTKIISPISVLLYSMQGRIVKQIIAKQSAIGGEMVIDISGLEQGVYFITVTGDNINLFDRFVKL